MAVIKTECDAATKAAFKALADREDATEAQLLRRLVEQALMASGGAPLPRRPALPVFGRKLDVRLPEEDLAQVRAIATTEGITAPWWVRALVRRRLDRQVVPFNPAETYAINRSIAQLGPLGRNLNQLTRRAHAGEPVTLEAGHVSALQAAVAELRERVLSLAERAAGRYDSE
ncbi:MAG: hypothetical protein M9927_25025 [Anaerolineae bacterium]|nr:hypothetical protein [Anaerolineae bacterium]